METPTPANGLVTKGAAIGGMECDWKCAQENKPWIYPHRYRTALRMDMRCVVFACFALLPVRTQDGFPDGSEEVLFRMVESMPQERPNEMFA